MFITYTLKNAFRAVPIQKSFEVMKKRIPSDAQEIKEMTQAELDAYLAPQRAKEKIENFVQMLEDLRNKKRFAQLDFKGQLISCGRSAQENLFRKSVRMQEGDLMPWVEHGLNFTRSEVLAIVDALETLTTDCYEAEGKDYQAFLAGDESMPNLNAIQQAKVI